MGTEFIDNGLQSLLAIPELACVPTRSASELLTAMSGLLATLGERDQSRLTAKLVESVQDTTTRCAAYWRGEYHQSWLELQEHPDQVRALRGLLVRLGYLSETVINHSSSNHRLAVTLAKALPSGFMIDLGVLHRACMVEYARLRSSPPSPTGETLALVGTNETATTAAAKFLSSRLHMQLLTFFRGQSSSCQKKMLMFSFRKTAAIQALSGRDAARAISANRRCGCGLHHGSSRQVTSRRAPVDDSLTWDQCL